MGGGSNFSATAPPVFDGDNYQRWIVRMETYLEALDLWEAVEEDYEIQFPSRKLYGGTNKITEGKKDEEIKGKSMSICSCISYGIHKDNVLEVSKRNLGLPQGRIRR